MGIEWYRDLSIIVLCLVMSVVLIFSAFLAYRFFHIAHSTLNMIKSTTKLAYDTVSLVQEVMKPILPILAIFSGVLGGFQGITKIFKKQNNEGGDTNE